jgi:hypothetical protein
MSEQEETTTTTTTVDESHLSTDEANELKGGKADVFEPDNADVLDENTTDSTTITAGASVAPADEGPNHRRSLTTNDVSQDQEATLEDAKAQALHNHSVEHADDPVPVSGDKTVV